jgi:E3 ubiquitin-protein ligase RNF115/126
MNSGKKYWCFTCNSECQINIIKQDDDEEYQCTKCKNTFIEEITQDNNPSDFHIQPQQQQPQQNIPNFTNNFSNLEGINITISTISNINPSNNINLSNFNNFGNNTQSNSNEPEPNYELGMNDTFLFLPSTVNYRKQESERNRIMSDFLTGGEIITEVVNPNGQNIIISRNFINSNSPINNFLLNHINDHQFENFINIITAFDLQHKGNPPASERAIKNLKKIEINENNIHDFDGQTCNVCLENFSEGQITNQLDCGHNFHEKCIVHWLKMRNTCPVCRHELESNDPNYEKRKHSNREMVRNLHNNSGNNNNNNNNNQPSPPA